MTEQAKPCLPECYRVVSDHEPPKNRTYHAPNCPNAPKAEPPPRKFVDLGMGVPVEIVPTPKLAPGYVAPASLPGSADQEWDKPAPKCAICSREESWQCVKCGSPRDSNSQTFELCFKCWGAEPAPTPAPVEKAGVDFEAAAKTANAWYYANRFEVFGAGRSELSRAYLALRAELAQAKDEIVAWTKDSNDAREAYTAAKEEIERLRAQNIELADRVVNRQAARERAEARVKELTESLAGIVEQEHTGKFRSDSRDQELAVGVALREAVFGRPVSDFFESFEIVRMAQDLHAELAQAKADIATNVAEHEKTLALLAQAKEEIARLDAYNDEVVGMHNNMQERINAEKAAREKAKARVKELGILIVKLANERCIDQVVFHLGEEARIILASNGDRASEQTKD